MLRPMVYPSLLDGLQHRGILFLVGQSHNHRTGIDIGSAVLVAVLVYFGHLCNTDLGVISQGSAHISGFQYHMDLYISDVLGQASSINTRL